jgi:hypothetical protein
MKSKLTQSMIKLRNNKSGSTGSGSGFGVASGYNYAYGQGIETGLKSGSGFGIGGFKETIKKQQPDKIFNNSLNNSFKN